MKTKTELKELTTGDYIYIRNRYNEFVNSGTITEILGNGDYLFKSDEDGFCYSSVSYPKTKYFRD